MLEKKMFLAVLFLFFYGTSCVGGSSSLYVCVRVRVRACVHANQLRKALPITLKAIFLYVSL